MSWQAPQHFSGIALLEVSLAAVEDETLMTVGISEPAWTATHTHWPHLLDRLRQALVDSGAPASVTADAPL